MKTLELFEHFEVERVPRWPLLVRLVGGSIVLHVILLACAFYVPAVRDALNLASMYSDTGFVDKAYKKVNIEDRAQILNLAKFQYPEGYFYKGEPMMPFDPNAPQIVAQAPPIVIQPPLMTKGRRVKEPPMSPLATPSPSPSPVADPVAQVATTDQQKTPAEADAEISKIAQDNNVAQVSDDEVNKQPWKDWLKNANDLKTQGKLDLSKPVEVVIIADFDENGKLQGEPTVFQKSGDPALIDLAKGLVSAIIESNLMKFLKDPKTKRLETKQLNITIKLDQKEVTGKVQSDAVSPERAQQLSQAYNGMLYFGKIAREGKDEATLIKNTKVSAEGKQIIINFTMPRQEASEMLKKQLQPAT